MNTAIVASVMDKARSGPLEGSGLLVGTCGEPGEGAYVRIWLIAENRRIQEASYATHGCPSSQLASAMTVTLCRGRTFDEAYRLMGRDVEKILGGLPPG